MSHQSDKELSDAMLDALIARERHGVVSPLTEWDTLAARLRDEGVIRVAGPSLASEAVPSGRYGRTAMPLRRYSVALQWGVRITAGVVLLGAGIVLGRGWTTSGHPPVRAVASNVRQSDVRQSDTVQNQTAPQPQVAPVATPVANTASASTEFHSADEARRAMNSAVAEYQRAAAYLAVAGAAKGTHAQQPEVYQLRLAALDQVLSATQEAMEQAPHDPVVKQYYISSVSARQATLRQLRQSLPEGVQLASY